MAGSTDVETLVERMPTTDLLGWIAYLRMKEQREQTRMVEALSMVAAKLWGKED